MTPSIDQDLFHIDTIHSNDTQQNHIFTSHLLAIVHFSDVLPADWRQIDQYWINI